MMTTLENVTTSKVTLMKTTLEYKQVLKMGQAVKDEQDSLSRFSSK